MKPSKIQYNIIQFKGEKPDLKVSFLKDNKLRAKRVGSGEGLLCSSSYAASREVGVCCLGNGEERLGRPQPGLS